MTVNRSLNAKSIPRGVPENYRAPVNRLERCPPDFLVRGAVLEADDPIRGHVAQCPRCMNIFMSARGSGWLH